MLSDETGGLLQRLSDINDGLNEWANSGGGGPSSVAGQHTLQRHRDILQVLYNIPRRIKKHNRKLKCLNGHYIAHFIGLSPRIQQNKVKCSKYY